MVNEICGPDALLRDSRRGTWVMTFPRPAFLFTVVSRTRGVGPLRETRRASGVSASMREGFVAFVCISALAGICRVTSPLGR